MRYEIATDIYEGPLSLFVELAKLNLLDVFLVKLQGLTAQYLALVKTGHATLNELAEPLPLFGSLLTMKARLLLPQPPRVEEEEEAPVSLEELERRLREYEQFKSVAQVLAQLHALQHAHLTKTRGERLPDTAESSDGESTASVEVGLLDLMTAFARILEKAPAPVYEVETEPWTVEMKVEELTLLLTVSRQLSFSEMFSTEKTTLELVVMFLALLELVRQGLCAAVQDAAFGEILIVRRESSGASWRSSTPSA